MNQVISRLARWGLGSAIVISAQHSFASSECHQYLQAFLDRGEQQPGISISNSGEVIVSEATKKNFTVATLADPQNPKDGTIVEITGSPTIGTVPELTKWRIVSLNGQIRSIVREIPSLGSISAQLEAQRNNMTKRRYSAPIRQVLSFRNGTPCKVDQVFSVSQSGGNNATSLLRTLDFDRTLCEELRSLQPNFWQDQREFPGVSRNSLERQKSGKQNSETQREEAIPEIEKKGITALVNRQLALNANKLRLPGENSQDTGAYPIRIGSFAARDVDELQSSSGPNVSASELKIFANLRNEQRRALRTVGQKCQQGFEQMRPTPTPAAPAPGNSRPAS